MAINSTYFLSPGANPVKDLRGEFTREIQVNCFEQNLPVVAFLYFTRKYYKNKDKKKNFI